MSENKPQLSTEPYKGTRDFYPQDMRVQNYIFSTWRKVVESFGYVEYGASILEDTNIYRAKSGSEIVNEQTYSFTDRGGRDVTIRPEMTPTVARMVARGRRELAFPLRWYSIPNLFRYERPQRGRLREHWQLNCDIFGVDSIEADVEIITVAYNIMKAFGSKDEDFEIRINDRRLMNQWFDRFDLDLESRLQINRTVDRKRKITDAAFREELLPIVQDKYEQLRKELDLDIDQFVRLLNTEVNHLALIQVRDRLNQLGIKNVLFDATLTRGFDYYTGTVFEVFDTSLENNRSLFGGGRYDDLVSIFGAEKVSGVGFGMGDVTIRDFLETHKLMPKLESTTKVYICVLHSGELRVTSYELIQKTVEELAKHLRTNNINVAVDYTGRKLDKQIKTAEKQGVPYIICIGEEEATSKKFKVKNLEKRETSEVVLEGLVKLLK